MERLYWRRRKKSRSVCRSLAKTTRRQRTTLGDILEDRQTDRQQWMELVAP